MPLAIQQHYATEYNGGIWSSNPTTVAQSEPQREIKSILLVDDTPEVLDVLTYFLVRAGFRVFSARSACNALELRQTEERPFDLLIADLKLGEGVSGLELAHYLRSKHPDLPVIFISGARADLWDPEVFLEGINYLPKPFSPGTLVRMATQWLSRRDRPDSCTVSAG